MFFDLNLNNQKKKRKTRICQTVTNKFCEDTLWCKTKIINVEFPWEREKKERKKFLDDDE